MASKSLLITLICSVMLSQLVMTSSLGVDMGDCLCMCDEGNEYISPSTGGKFLDSIKGLKGDMGSPGNIGLPGISGASGEPGARGPSGETVNKSPSANVYPSCNKVKATGRTTSGIYKIKPTGLPMNKIDVYCDMESGGGGWTLIASIHENNIYGKCTLGDRWSSEQGVDTQYNSSGNWETFSTFGTVESATSDDYKSAAYSYLVASDIMVWHVPNDVFPSQWSDKAFLKYYTTSGFLSQYGGTLQILYSKYFPMTSVNQSGDLTPGMSTIMQTINATAPDIRNQVSGFYRYNYDSSQYTSISDGGGDMFDTGNMVYYKIGDGSWKQITYGKTYYDLASGVQVSSIFGQPFIMLMWIENPGGAIDTFGIKVHSGTGADSGGSTVSYTDSLSHGNIVCEYHSYNVYGVSDPSICEVYFACYNEQDWQSTRFSNFQRVSWSSATDNLRNSVEIEGSPQKVMMGYTLLSKQGGVKVTKNEVENVLSRMLTATQGMQAIPTINCSRASESLTVPVTYAKGNTSEVLRRIPPAQRSRVTPGFLQFRPVDPEGNPNAFCPGVKSEACRQQSICIGGIKPKPDSSSDIKNTCGDFAGWRGMASDTPNGTEPTGSARANSDIKSTILIFAR